MLRVIWLFPIGRGLEEDIIFCQRAIQEYLGAATFLGKRIEIPKEIPTRFDQIEAKALLKALPDSPGYKLGIVDEDLFVYGMNFVFGLAFPSKMKAVVSTYRLRCEDRFLYLSRLLKEVIHELGHLFGLDHCQDPKCVMFFSNSIWDTDRKGWKYCNYCSRKLKEKGIYLNEDFSID